MESLYEIIESKCNKDPFWADSLKKYFDSLVSIDEEIKIQFLKKLIKNDELFNDFTGEVIKPIDANELFNKYWMLIMQETSKEVKNNVHALSIPLRNDFTINTKKMDSPLIIMSYANEQGINQTVTSDGTLKEGENFEDRINKVTSNAKAFAKTFSNKNVDENLFFYKDFKATFDYKVYVHDVIFDNAEKPTCLRQFIAYFVDPKVNEFYQLTISVGKFDYPTELITIGKLDENNPIMKEVIGILDNVMNGIRYK